jgi:hypothetical protein
VVEHEQQRAQHDRRHDAAEHDEREVVSLLHGGRRRRVGTRQQRVVVGRLHRDRRRRRGGEERREQPARAPEQRVGDEPDARDRQASARVGEQERRADHRQRTGGEHANTPALVGRGKVQAEHRGDRAEHAERVPVGQRIGEPAVGGWIERRREVVGLDTRKQRNVATPAIASAMPRIAQVIRTRVRPTDA